MAIDDEGGTPWRPTGYCSMFVCDIIGFGGRSDGAQTYLRKSLYGGLERAFAESGLSFSGCYHEDRGDGVIVVLPPEQDAHRLVHPLPDHLQGELRRHNELAAEAARMRLRVALHAGRVESDSNGIVGTSVNTVNRLLDAPSFKETLSGASAVFGLIVSGEFHEDVIAEGRGAIDPGAFRQLKVKVKELETVAWVSVPGTVAVPEAGGDVAVRPIREPVNPPRQEVGAARRGLDLFALVDLLLGIPLLTSPEGREQVLGELSREIATRIPRRAQAHLDLHSIVRTCLEYPNGIEEFLDVVHGFVGASSAFAAVEAALNGQVRPPR